MPDEIDVKAIKIAALEQERKNLRAAFQAKITEIERRISELTAIEFTPEVSA